jgi:hypothetical protein
MYNLLLVHGTGVRQPSYDDTYAAITARLAVGLRNCTLHRCYWGETEGCRLRSSGASIPDYDTARAVAEVDPEDVAVAKWRLLYADPDFELDAFLASAGSAKPFNPAAETFFEGISTLLEIETAETRGLEAELGLASVWKRAKSQLRASLASAAANDRTVPDLNSEFRTVLARALVAHAFVIAFEAEASGNDRNWPTGSQRDALVNALRDTWGGDDRGVLSGISGWVGDRFKRLALRIGTGKIARKRGSISDAAFPATGDILLYQARGEGVRDFIERTVHKTPKPIVLLAHSLGGIACVDLLAKKQLDGVVKLITVGSQAPLLYELNALWSLPYGDPLPASFPD